MIDIHSHILPGVDDGASTEEESISMAKRAVELGINTIIATPHHRNRSYDNYKPEIKKNVAILNELLNERQIPLKVLCGQEVRIYGELIDDLKNGDIQTLHNTKYILIEFPYSGTPQYAEKLLYDLQIAGLRPIIAHPERYHDLRENHERMYKLIRNGALAQLTAGSLLGEYGKEVEQFSYQLLDANLVHFIASDAHNMTSRSFDLVEAYEKIKSRYGFETYYALMENCQLLIDDANINLFEPERIKSRRKSFFSFLKKK